MRPTCPSEVRPRDATRCARIHTFVNAGSGSAVHDLPWLSHLVIRRRIEDRRVSRIHGQVDHAHVVVDEEHLVPRPSAIRRLEHSSLGILREQMSHGRDVDDVRVHRIDRDLGNVVGVFESDALPRLAGVQRLYTPSPARELRDVNASPVPTHTTSGFDGAVTTAPIESLAWPSNTGSNVVPLFVVFQSPPVQKPTYQVYR